MNNASPNLFFTVETFSVENGFSLKSVERDSDGYFKGIPLAVLGTITRNNTHYDVQSMINQITKPNTAFNIRLTEGCLEGEFSHPVVDFNTAYGRARIMTIDPTKEALHYRKIYTKNLNNSDKIVIFGDAKPSGPYGQYFEERMIDPTRNCAFSLRSITQDKLDKKTGVTYKTVIQLITFDAGVPSGGYKEASKRYMDSTESLFLNKEEVYDYTSCPVNFDDVINNSGVGCEEIFDNEVLDIFQTNKLTIDRKIIGIIDNKRKLIHSTDGNKRGIFGSFLSIK